MSTRKPDQSRADRFADDINLDPAENRFETDDDPVRASRGAIRNSSRRGPIARLFFVIRLILVLGPITILAVGSLVVDCRTRSQATLVPDVIRAGACARQDVTRHVLGIEGALRTIADRLR